MMRGLRNNLHLLIIGYKIIKTTVYDLYRQIKVLVAGLAQYDLHRQVEMLVASLAHYNLYRQSLRLTLCILEVNYFYLKGLKQ